MPLATNQQNFNTKIKSVLKKKAKAAFIKTFEETEKTDKDEIAEEIATKFAEEMSKSSTDLGTAITEHILSLTLTPILVAPPNGGPVTGTITLS